MKRVLVVDDQEQMLSAMLLYLRVRGYVADGERSAAAALARFRPGEWDVVITDLTMPEMDGDEFAAEVRSLDANVPIVLSTGVPSASKAPEIYAAVLTKPFSGEDVIACVQGIELRG